jgi:tRNA(Ile)-lysidine synthase
VSGGADSTALLLALASLRPEFGLELAAAHLHHGLRGAEADLDLRHVRALCSRLGVPLTAARWDTRSRMRARSLSGQAGLRTLRREFLLAARRSAGAQAIATAHTADDQLETVLMRLLRGAGLPGLGGMRPRFGRWIKPMLEATRADIEADLCAASEPWREDASNADPNYLRSRIRHQVVPALLAARGPGASRAALARGVAAGARELRDADAALTIRARRGVARHGGGDGERAWISRPALAAAPRALRLALLRRLWRDAGAPRAGLTRRHLDALLALAAGGRPGSRVELPAGRCASCRGGRLMIESSGARGAERAPRGDAKLARSRRSGSAVRASGPRRSIALRERV